jgi:hypothetical protein
MPAIQKSVTLSRRAEMDDKSWQLDAAVTSIVVAINPAGNLVKLAVPAPGVSGATFDELICDSAVARF